MEIFSDEYFMKEALKEAKKAYESDEVPIGAVIVSNNRIIARAHNQTEKLNDVTAHAEILAVTSASNFLSSKYLSDCTIYVTLEPCIMCAGALFWSKISSIVYGASDANNGFSSIETNIIHPKTDIKKGVLELECSQIIKDFFKVKRQKEI